MLTEPTHQKLRAMRLTGMAEALSAQQSDPEATGLSFDERLALIVDAEELFRDNRRRARLMREAKLRIPSACVEDLNCSAARGLGRDQVRQLLTDRWLEESRNLLITGKTGTGKTYVSCAFGQRACRRGQRTIYRRLSRLLQEFMQARANGTYPRLLQSLSRAQMLIIDDWGLTPLNDTSRRDLLELFDDRYGSRSTVITSQLAVKHWHEYIGEPTVADAILDRLVHNAFKIELKGPSRRRPTQADDGA
jgi:DNA replication protein DnaC